MMQRWDDLTPEEQARYEDREQLLAQLAAAEQALALATNSEPGKPTVVMMTLDKWTEHLAEVERFAADQWRNGNASREPQEFDEWRREQAQPRE